MDILLNILPYTVARWIAGENLDLKKVKNMDSGMLVTDIKERPVALVNNEWQLKWVVERNPDLNFLALPE